MTQKAAVVVRTGLEALAFAVVSLYLVGAVQSDCQAGQPYPGSAVYPSTSMAWNTTAIQSRMQAATLVQTARMLLQQNKLFEAESALNSAVTLDPNNRMAAYLLGVVQARTVPQKVNQQASGTAPGTGRSAVPQQMITAPGNLGPSSVGGGFGGGYGGGVGGGNFNGNGGGFGNSGNGAGIPRVMAGPSAGGFGGGGISYVTIRRPTLDSQTIVNQFFFGQTGNNATTYGQNPYGPLR